MKKTFLIFFLSLSFFGKSKAQVEFKVETLGLAFGQFYTSLEFLAPNNISFELGAGYRLFDFAEQKGAHLLVSAKYYFRSFRGHDELYFGLYGKPTVLYNYDRLQSTGVDFGEKRSGLAAGLLVGRKWRTFQNDKITIDLQLGIGKLLFRKEVLAIRPGVNSFPSFINFESLFDLVFNFTVGYRLN